MQLTDRVREVVDQHGSIRAAGRALRIDPGYLSRLWSGEKTNPSKAVLKKLGLRRVDNYERI